MQQTDRTFIEKTLDKEKFTNKGFTLVYNDVLFENKIISKKLDNRSFFIFQKNLKQGTNVKIINLLNKKSIIAEVSHDSIYPSFHNSIITTRISEEIELNLQEPYIEIIEIKNSSLFIAKKAKTFEEEKKVANKAPIDSISIDDINIQNKKKIKKAVIIKPKPFNYIIKIADFYFKDSAKSMVLRIKKETSLKNVSLKKISKDEFRVFLGPYMEIKSLQKAFNDINILQFENIEIIKNVKIK
jgi:hypothetical protein|tara:strand:+ start:141 stop:866 length:726 start_codon:yes stop_codon:yes gene_type:complete